MPPANPSITGRDRRVSELIEFAQDLLSKLPTSYDSSSTDALLADLDHHISTVSGISECPASISSKTANDLKDVGRKLWNECIREKRKRNDMLASRSKSTLLVRTRIFAFLAHTLARDSCRGRRADAEEDAIYSVNLALTLARICVDELDLEGARLAMTKSTQYIDQLKEAGMTSPIDDIRRRKLEAEHLAMRCALSWKEDRLDVAEFIYGKAKSLLQHLEPSSAELLADTFQHIGAGFSTKADYVMALKWLRRAQALINSQELGSLSTAGLELRMATHHELIQALIGVGTDQSIQEADALRSSDEAFDTNGCASVLRRMIRSLDLSDTGLGFLLHNIKVLRDRNPRLALSLLEELLRTRLLRSGNMSWIGKTLIRRVWMGTMEMEASEAAANLTQLLDELVQECGQCNADITAAAQSLIWKKLDAIYSKKQYQATKMWCQVALHPIFSNSGESSQGKFGRKLILCAIASDDIEAAKSTYHSMPKSVQDEQLTRYLMFKASLIGWDHDLGRQCVEFISKSTDKSKSQDILYACVREAQHIGDKLCTLEALKAIAETISYEASPAANLPSILRCSIRLIHLVEAEQGEEADGVSKLTEDTCNIFEKDISSEEATDLRLMAMRCHFVIAAALVSVARAEDKVDEQLQRYLEMRRHITAFDELFEKNFENDSRNRDGRVYTDLMSKMSILFVFDFEAAICLKSWDDLSKIVRKGRACKDEQIYKAMGDCLLRSQASGQVMYTAMRLIINEIFALEQFDSRQLGKYMRCVFQAILPLDDNLALQVVQQALQVAQEGRQMQKSFPAQELDWIVATAFNHSLDILARGDEKLCQQWALKALELAEYMDDGGDMKHVLRERVVKMGLGSGSINMCGSFALHVSAVDQRQTHICPLRPFQKVDSSMGPAQRRCVVYPSIPCSDAAIQEQFKKSKDKEKKDA
ncbi:transcription factor [Fusarium albosuccineum]|uniref:Transcription factor n=1 Tax=Fusarium albosuccineum TaxID=1237068 RepID=A0A8H4P7V5_9HYPO|nr:transcription factor [Fusarium albosuccineum]